MGESHFPEKEKYVGNAFQLGGTRRYCLTDGIANGCRCIDVNTGSGFAYTVVCDRGLDISLASYQGINLVFLTENAEAHPAFFDAADTNWLRTFSGGLLTTCGPSHLGPPCEDGGETLGQHGRWTALPAKNVYSKTDYKTGKIEITGELKDSAPFGHKISIHRTITSYLGKNEVTVEDTITNEGGQAVPLNVLYHINFGYPFLSEDMTVRIPSKQCVGYDDTDKQLLEQASVKAPQNNHLEKNYLHTFEGQDRITAWVHNPKLKNGLAAAVTFDPRELPYLTQWVLENVKDYVLALEPANVPCQSRSFLRESNLLPFLQPGEAKTLRVKIEVMAENETIRKKLG